MSSVTAHWDLMPRIVEIRNSIAPNTLIIGNGGVLDTDDARKKCEENACEGVMLGKAIFGNPWLFTSPPAPLLGKERGAASGVRSIAEKLKVMLEHTKLFEQMLGSHKNFAIMKKHYKAYANGFPATAGRDGAKELRMKLMGTNNGEEVEQIVKKFLGTNF